MADRARGMGRGLSAILASTGSIDGGTAAPGALAPELRELPVELVRPNPAQPRRHFDEEALVGLSESLRERGVLQPILVRPVPGGTYEIVAGERRWRAARLAGLETIPAVVRAQDDDESLELALIENMARQDLSPVEEARACAMLVDELGLTREDVGRRVGRSRVAVSNLMRLLGLPDEVLDLIAAGRLSEGHGRALLMAGDHADRRRLARRVVEEGWSVRQTESAARAAAAAEIADGELVVRRARGLHPDQAEAVGQLSDAFGRSLGPAVRVAPSGTGYRVSVAFESAEEALALADRLALSSRAVAGD